MMSELFQVTLDELIKGEKSGQCQQTMEVQPAEHPVTDRRHFTAGIVCIAAGLCISFIGQLMTGSMVSFLFFLPFLTCAIVCFCVTKHTLLWASWAFLIPVEYFLRCFTWIRPGLVLYTISYIRNNDTSMLVAWLWFLPLLVLSACTLRAIGIPKYERSAKGIAGLTVSVLLYLALLKWGMERVNWGFFWGAIQEGISLLMCAIAVYGMRYVAGRTKTYRENKMKSLARKPDN